MVRKYHTTIRILTTMNKVKATNKEKVRCVFCNSLSHKMERCNSNMNGRREHLDEGWDFMMHGGCPRFDNFAANELRYIAWHYAAYKGAIHDWKEKTTQTYNRKFQFRPVDLTLSKAQLIKELTRRWDEYQHVRESVLCKPEPRVDDECPICLDCTTTTYNWSYNISNWVKHSDNITTECKHSFCKKCWTTHVEKNARYKCMSGYTCVSCPLCRHQIKVI